MAPTFVLITGGNRGLGWGLVKRFLEQPHHVGLEHGLWTVVWYEAENLNRLSLLPIGTPAIRPHKHLLTYLRVREAV